jgi:hypothetical protein
MDPHPLAAIKDSSVEHKEKIIPFMLGELINLIKE